MTRISQRRINLEKRLSEMYNDFVEIGLKESAKGNKKFYVVDWGNIPFNARPGRYLIDYTMDNTIYDGRYRTKHIIVDQFNGVRGFKCGNESYIDRLSTDALEEFVDAVKKVIKEYK